jgi:hypothetical protein
MITYWVGLANKGKEIKSPKYKRKLCTFELFKHPNGQAFVTNTKKISWKCNGDAWGNVTNVVLYDNSEHGGFCYALNVYTIDVKEGWTLTFDPKQIVMDLTKEYT